ncbi:PLP-dependent transferase [Dendrothele bispora CBS 962.96]|uniref:PLP-dependent transferase n=1 Tax=Dendrothele bispora (strain CBS 962.96) TaxID=1314807 RepID=A0A4S8MM61_DENBC|nr:PLP-dependent transferase [Dendrothele bispora CBS 962.96]
MTLANDLDIEQTRAHFPALRSGHIFADNAGGSQVPKDVVDRISDYLLNTNVQVNVDYSISIQSTQRVAEGRAAAARLLNAAKPEQIILGGSSTANMENLLRQFDGDVNAGDEFILMDGEHEANNGTWKKLAARTGAIIKYWHPVITSPENPFSVVHRVEHLTPLITPKTRVVAFSACSNILGSVVPVKEISKAVRAEAAAKGAQKVDISIDAVAYAPHRRIDVQDWDIDFCMLSFYKVYGPHAAALYVRSPVHPSSSSVAHELVYGSTGILPYLLSLTPINDLQATFDAIASHEKSLVDPLLAFFTHPEQRARGLMIVGSEDAHDIGRVPTISFVIQGENPIPSQEIVKRINRKGGVGIRGYKYSCTTEDGVQLSLDGGVARISLVHYNTVEEVHKIIEILKEIIYT